MNVAAQVIVRLAAHDERDLAVRLESDDAVNNVHASLFQPLRPFYVVLFVKARLDLDNRSHLLALFASFNQRLRDGRILARAIKTHLDGEHFRVFSRRVNKLHDRRIGSVRMMQEHVLPLDHLED